MLSAIADHLWQSLLFCALGAALAMLARGNSAVLRLWIWRVCLWKFLVPFALLFAAGDWLGLPERYSGNPVPPGLATASALVTPWLAPVRSAAVSRGFALLCLLAALCAAVVCARFLVHALRLEAARADGESSGARELPPLGFFRALVMTSCALAALWIPLLGGAIADRAWRYDLLVEHMRALREAPVAMNRAAPGMGSRMRVIARGNGVLIRNANVRELIALSYGVTSFAVWTNQMYTRKDDAEVSWWLAPRYDVQIGATLRDPDDFDPWALRERMTKFLVAQFGIEIHLNGECQKPCGRWDTSEGVALPAEPPGL